MLLLNFVSAFLSLSTFAYPQSSLTAIGGWIYISANGKASIFMSLQVLAIADLTESIYLCRTMEKVCFLGQTTHYISFPMTTKKLENVI